MSTRLEVAKTYKLYIDGKFPRSESGRSMIVKAADGTVFAHLCHSSRKDLRDAVESARKALPGWSGATAYLRGQIIYRIAEMLEGKRRELAEAIE
ncbi:MAG: aldehyde dehydrogenase family protein, partial [Phycisphaerae bacterium]